MNTLKIFKALCACTGSDESRGILQFIYREKKADDVETLVATDGRILAVVRVPSLNIELAIHKDVIIRKETEFGTFYIDRKRKDIDCTSPYPNWRVAIPYLKPADIIGGHTEAPKAIFATETLKRAATLWTEWHGFKSSDAARNTFVPTHFPDIDHHFMPHICMHGRAERGIFVGIMPVRTISENRIHNSPVNTNNIMELFN